MKKITTFFIGIIASGIILSAIYTFEYLNSKINIFAISLIISALALIYIIGDGVMKVIFNKW